MTKRLLEHWFDEMHVGQEEITRGRTVTETDVVQWSMFTLVLQSLLRMRAREPNLSYNTSSGLQGAEKIPAEAK